MLIIAAQRAEKRIIDRLTQAQATRPDASLPLADLPHMEARQLRRLGRTGSVREVTPGQFYLDEPVYAAYRTRRRVMASAFLAIGAVIGAFLYFQYGRG